jgi:hypothetical protein
LARHVDRVEETWNSQKISEGKLRKWHLGRSERRWEDNMKINCKEVFYDNLLS